MIDLRLGDMLKVLPTLDADSVDAVVCDPPYDLTSKHGDRIPQFGNSVGAQQERKLRGSGGGFMAMKWDSTGIAFKVETWQQVYRVMKPGAYLLAFGGTRTYHRMVCAIEDAGFEIRDCLQWLYGSGFPKSMDVSKQFDKMAGAEREVVGRYNADLNWRGVADPDDPRYEGRGNTRKASMQGHVPGGLGRMRDITAPATDLARQWSGWGTALKPACEPIVLARKPLSEATVAANVAKHGTGAINIAASRIGTSEELRRPFGTPSEHIGQLKNLPHGELNTGSPAGRWPANVILSHSEDCRQVDAWECVPGCAVAELDRQQPSTSRFFYVAKASRRERNEGCEGLPEQRSGTGALRQEQGGEYLDFLYPAPSGIGAWLREQRESAGLTLKDVAQHFPSRTGGLTGCVVNWEKEYNRPTPDQWRTLREILRFDGRHDEVMTTLQPVPHAVRTEPVAIKTNHHPTVKPVQLTRYLIRLVTPPGGTVLDPFAGSGSTLVAAIHEGCDGIGIEQDESYYTIAQARITAAAATFHQLELVP